MVAIVEQPPSPLGESVEPPGDAHLEALDQATQLSPIVSLGDEMNVVALDGVVDESSVLVEAARGAEGALEQAEGLEVP